MPIGGIGGQHGDDVVDAARHAAIEIACLESRRDRVGDDDLRSRVRQRAFKAVADLDANAMLLGRDEEQRAVILLRLAQLPGAKQRVGVGLDLLALERGNRRDDELDARLALQRRELAFEGAALIGRQNIGRVDNAPGQDGEIRRRRERQRRRQQQRQQRRKPTRRANRAQNFTFGAASEPLSAVNSTNGLLPLKNVDAQITLGNVRSAVL